MTRGVLAGLLLVLMGCGETPPQGVACAAYAAAGLEVVVVDAVTALPVCDALVVASEGAYAETLAPLSCRYVGAFERPGTYVVRATRSRYREASRSSVVVALDGAECPHVIQVRVELLMSPTP